jgi:hypothetical protein
MKVFRQFLYGVLRSSLRASNQKQQQRYAVWVMCQTLQSCYAASQQERAEAQNRVPQRRWAPKGAWGASSATGCLLYLPTQRSRGRKDRW